MPELLEYAFDYDDDDGPEDAPYPGELVDVLVAHGADVVGAERAVLAMTKQTRPTTCCEIYGRGKLMQAEPQPHRAEGDRFANGAA